MSSRPRSLPNTTRIYVITRKEVQSSRVLSYLVERLLTTVVSLVRAIRVTCSRS